MSNTYIHVLGLQIAEMERALKCAPAGREEALAEVDRMKQAKVALRRGAVVIEHLLSLVSGGDRDAERWLGGWNARANN